MKAPIVKAKGKIPLATFSPPQMTRYLNLVPGDPLMIWREPENPHDANAIRLLYKDHYVCYADKKSAAVITAWMNKGWVYQAQVWSVSSLSSPARDGYQKILRFTGILFTPIMQMKGKRSVKTDVRNPRKARRPANVD